MAKGMAIVLWMVPLLAVSCCLCLDAAEETEQVLTAAQIEKLAQRRVMEEVQKELDLRELAAELKLDWPVVPSSYTFTEHYERAVRQAKAEGVVKFPDSLVETAKTEAEERFKVLKVGDNAKIVSSKPPHRVYEGRIQAITDTYLRIGNTGNVWLQDLDAETLARFSEEKSKEMKEHFVDLAKKKMEINRQALAEELLPSLFEKELLSDGYKAINEDKKKPKLYLAQSNWLNKAAVLEEKAEALKQELYNDKIKETREELYKLYGYEFDSFGGRWRLLNRLHDLPLTGSVDLERSFLEKLQGK